MSAVCDPFENLNAVVREKLNLKTDSIEVALNRCTRATRRFGQDYLTSKLDEADNSCLTERSARRILATAADSRRNAPQDPRNRHNQEGKVPQTAARPDETAFSVVRSRWDRSFASGAQTRPFHVASRALKEIQSAVTQIRNDRCEVESPVPAQPIGHLPFSHRIEM